VQKFSLAARHRGVALEVDAMAAATIVKGDIALLERVLDNLIDNALRHTPAGGCVTVRSEPRGERVRIAVTDTGPGLTAEESRRVFDRFYRGDPGRSTSSGQSGLGLAIVKSILELHGSDVAVESQPGHGASFYFELPIAARSPSSAST
jgi:signal transduction histidine kinase